MDTKTKLVKIIKAASLPPEVESKLLEEVEKQQTITEEFVLDIADTLEKSGIYMKTLAEIQQEVLTELENEGRKVNGAVKMIDNVAEEVVKGTEKVASAVPPQVVTNPSQTF